MRKGGHPDIAEIGKATHFKAIGTEEKIGSKVFGIKLPLDYEDKLKTLPRDERVKLLRSAVIKAIDEYENN